VWLLISDEHAFAIPENDVFVGNETLSVVGFLYLFQEDESSKRVCAPEFGGIFQSKSIRYFSVCPFHVEFSSRVFRDVAARNVRLV
jgi:drug/metabolite transporter superfamily protein YnfA